MTEKQIEEASEKFAEENVLYPEVSCESDIITLTESVVAAFKDGAKWRINSVWHKPEEVPEADRDIIVKSNKEYQTWMLSQYLLPDWKDMVKDYKTTRWAYIDDLIPDEDETA